MTTEITSWSKGDRVILYIENGDHYYLQAAIIESVEDEIVLDTGDRFRLDGSPLIPLRSARFVRLRRSEPWLEEQLRRQDLLDHIKAAKWADLDLSTETLAEIVQLINGELQP